jgi:signal transduction histidine kinase
MLVSPLYLTSAVDAAREKERIRIARELHDELGSALSAVRWDLDGLRQHISEPAGSAPAQGRALLDSATHGIDATLASVRRIAADLRPSVLDDLGLAAAVDWQVQQFETATGIRTIADILVADDALLDAEVQTAVFRILQEALTNVRRHAHADSVHVLLEQDRDGLSLEVADDGVGVDEAVAGAPSSLGLMGMRERAVLAGGQFTIHRSAAGGTTVTVRIPARRSVRRES